LGRAGAFHGSEIGLVFGSIEYQQTFYSAMIKEKISYPDTAEQKSLTKTMMTAWASFAKDPENGLEKLGWPVYDSTSTSFRQLRVDNMH
jgi:carboxylesterase type B